MSKPEPSVIFAKKDELLEVAQDQKKRKTILQKMKRPLDYMSCLLHH
jgi:hypothetical protein